MILNARVAAPIKDVRHALTDPASLRIWLAENAEVDLPHRYEFWGATTPEGHEPHQRPLHVDDTTVRFSWLLEGEDTTVEFSLREETDETTVLSLSQSHFPGWEAAVTEKSILGTLQTYWCLVIANLIDHLEGRELTPACDFTSPEMREQVTIAASPQAVFDSLVDEEKFATWFGAVAGIEPYVGGRFAMGGFEHNPAPAKIIELEPGRSMAIEFPGGMVSAWELEGSEGRTTLTFVQSGFDAAHPPYGAWMGWLSGIAELRRYHELSDWRPVWLESDIPGLPDGMLTDH